MKKRKFKKNKKINIGVGWYRQEQWSLLREQSEDAEQLENTHFEWVINANESIKDIESTGHSIVKIDIDINELIEWCRKENLPVNGKSRAQFISLKTKELKG